MILGSDVGMSNTNQRCVDGKSGMRAVQDLTRGGSVARAGGSWNGLCCLYIHPTIYAPRICAFFCFFYEARHTQNGQRCVDYTSGKHAAQDLTRGGSVSHAGGFWNGLSCLYIHATIYAPHICDFGF